MASFPADLSLLPPPGARIARVDSWRFQVLGPPGIYYRDASVPLGGPKQRALASLLMLRQGSVVDIDTIVQQLWEDNPPRTAVRQVQDRISRLRAALSQVAGGSEVLLSRPPGYLLRTDVGAFDLMVFETRARAGRAAWRCGDSHAAIVSLRQALDAWTGDALAGIDSPSIRAQAVSLVERRSVVFDIYATAMRAVRRHDDLLPELTATFYANPLRESLCAQLMVTLFERGRRVDALEAYGLTRLALRQDLNMEPARPLRTLHHMILVDDHEAIASRSSQQWAYT